MMTIAEDIGRLEAALEEDPSDVETRMVLADAYEEAGEQSLADTNRWMVRWGRYPRKKEGWYYFFANPPKGDHCYLGDLAVRMRADPEGRSPPAYTSQKKAVESLDEELSKTGHPCLF